jgi:O-antigen ligase
MVALLMVELVVTTSRGAVLAAAVGVTFFGAWSRRRIASRHAVLVAVGAAVLGVTVGVGVLLGGLPDYRSADVLLRTGEGTTPALRVELWRTAGRMAGKDPLTGVGPDGFGRAFDTLKSERFVRAFGPELVATDAHNQFLTVLATTGLPGLLAFSAVVGSAFVRLRTSARIADVPAGVPDPLPADDGRVLTASVGAAMLAYVLQASFNRHDIALEFCFWFLLGLSCAFCDSERPAQAARRGRRRAARATATATAPTASATQEITSSSSSSSPPSDSPPAATSLMSLHHS